MINMDEMISVILPVYNEPLHYLSESLGSITHQTYKNLEIIVIVDNPDNEQVINFISEAAKLDSRIRLIVNEENIGLTKTLNKAIKMTSGKLIARMDADDYSFPNRLEKELQLMNKYQLDFVGANIVEIDQDGKETGIITKFPHSHKYIKTYIRYGDPMLHPTWLLKKSVYTKLNGYREIMAAEDCDFVVRAALSGFKLGVSREPLVKYRINQNSISRTNHKTQANNGLRVERGYRQGRIISLDELNRTDNLVKLNKFMQLFRKLRRFSLRLR